MPSGLIFLTGGTGHIGFRTLVLALQAGYNIRAAVRSDAKKDLILRNKEIKSLNPGPKLTFVIIEDISIPGAYDAAIQGADYVIHLASPIVLKEEVKVEDYESLFVDTAVAGTKSILDAAAKAPSVKRVVITSSMSAILPWTSFTTGDDHTIYNETSRTPFWSGPYANDFEAYNAGKVKALAYVEEYVKTHTLSFGVVNIAPGFTAGRVGLLEDARDIMVGTNIAAIGHVFGHKAAYGNPAFNVHVDDVARLHVEALDPKIPANSLWVAVSGPLEGNVWNDAIGIAAKRYPEAIKAGLFSNDGDQPTLPSRIDKTATKMMFGIEFKGFEEQVTDVLDHFLELKGLPIA